MTDTAPATQPNRAANKNALRPSLDGVQSKAQDNAWRTLSEFSVRSEPGNERRAMEQVVEAVQELNLTVACLERLKTAVAEATMNAMEHGNQYRPDEPVSIQVLTSESALAVHITDQGNGQPIPEAETPDLDAKLAGLQTPRGWGLFLIKNMVDEMRVRTDETHHTVELIFDLEAEKNASSAPFGVLAEGSGEDAGASGEEQLEGDRNAATTETETA